MNVSTFPCPRSRLRIWSRETGSAVLSHVSLLISILFRLNLVLVYLHGIPPKFHGRVHLFIYNRHTIRHRVSPAFIGSRNCVPMDGVHYHRESAGTGPVNLKVVPNECCCLGRSPWTNYYAPLFPAPTFNRVAKKMRTYFEMGTDGHRFLCF